jgi:hypothetical protein
VARLDSSQVLFVSLRSCARIGDCPAAFPNSRWSRRINDGSSWDERRESRKSCRSERPVRPVRRPQGWIAPPVRRADPGQTAREVLVLRRSLRGAFLRSLRASSSTLFATSQFAAMAGARSPTASPPRRRVGHSTAMSKGREQLAARPAVAEGNVAEQFTAPEAFADASGRRRKRRNCPTSAQGTNWVSPTKGDKRGDLSHRPASSRLTSRQRELSSPFDKSVVNRVTHLHCSAEAPRQLSDRYVGDRHPTGIGTRRHPGRP